MAAESRGVIPITVTVTLEPKPDTGIGGGGISPQESAFPTPSPTDTPNVTPSASGAPASASPTPTPTVTPTPSMIQGILASSQAEASQLFRERFRVMFGFDGQISTSQNQAGEVRRAAGWGADKSTFTWKRFVTLEDSYNPYGVGSGYPAGTLNPWSLKKWYQWGCRQFHFHNPFGKVVQGKTQQLVYEVDQFLNARDGLTINGQVQNTPCPWMVNDFVNVVRALTTGTRGRLDQATWDSWTTGPEAWFNPNEPIDLIVYIGGMADFPDGDEGYGTYISRWQNLWNTNPRAAARRLKESVQPLISAYCKIGFDAVVASPGPVPGDNVALSVQNRVMQQGWWDFWKWLETKIGKNRIYVESHPFKKGTGRANPYLGYNVIADDDWSTSQCCPATTGSQGPHATSEMGAVEFWRAIWQQAPTRTPLLSTMKGGVRTLERYAFLESDPLSVQSVTSEFDASVTERRLTPANCCSPNHNYYHSHLYASIAAFHMLEKQHIRGEPNPAANITKAGILIPSTILQVLPQSFAGDSRYVKQFGYRFPTAASFVQYLAGVIDKKKRAQDTVFDPFL